MSATSNIEWTDATWSPVKGCSRVSKGCERCYAETLAGRFCGTGLPMHGFATRGEAGARWTGRVELAPDRLAIPIRWREPRRIFVNSQSDSFHEKLSNEDIAAIFGVMAARPDHTFQVLTKRAERMAEWFRWVVQELRGRFRVPALIEHAACSIKGALGERASDPAFRASVLAAGKDTWPLPNVHLGVSVESQDYAEERIPWLLETPAAVRFLSCEPLLGPVDLWAFLKSPLRDESLAALNVSKPMPGVDWVIVGGESGVGARPMEIEWARRIVADCRAAGVGCFVKQLGAVPVIADPPRVGLPREQWPEMEWPEGTHFGSFGVGLGSRYQGRVVHLRDRKGGDVDEWPEGFRVRELPEVTK